MTSEVPQTAQRPLFGVCGCPDCPLLFGREMANRQEVKGAGAVAVAAAALSTSVVVGELSAWEMGCRGACLLAIILAS